jgi:hypothetical protein
VRYGATINPSNARDADIPLFVNLMCGDCDDRLEMTKALLNNGADPNMLCEETAFPALGHAIAGAAAGDARVLQTIRLLLEVTDRVHMNRIGRLRSSGVLLTILTQATMAHDSSGVIDALIKAGALLESPREAKCAYSDAIAALKFYHMGSVENFRAMLRNVNPLRRLNELPIEAILQQDVERLYMCPRCGPDCGPLVQDLMRCLAEERERFIMQVAERMLLLWRLPDDACLSHDLLCVIAGTLSMLPQCFP